MEHYARQAPSIEKHGQAKCLAMLSSIVRRVEGCVQRCRQVNLSLHLQYLSCVRLLWEC